MVRLSTVSTNRDTVSIKAPSASSSIKVPPPAVDGQLGTSQTPRLPSPDTIEDRSCQSEQEDDSASDIEVTNDMPLVSMALICGV